MIAERNLTIPPAMGSVGTDPAEAALWSPPEAPMDMPAQVLERAPLRLDLGRLFTLFAPRLRA